MKHNKGTVCSSHTNINNYIKKDVKVGDFSELDFTHLVASLSLDNFIWSECGGTSPSLSSSLKVNEPN